MYVISKVEKKMNITFKNGATTEHIVYAVNIVDLFKPTKVITEFIPEDKFDSYLFRKGDTVYLTLWQRIRMFLP